MKLKTLSKWSLATAIALFLTQAPAKAQPPNTAPESLTRLLSQLETAANNGDIGTVRAAYSNDFMTASGLNQQELAQKLQQLWDNYSRLDYQVELQNWERQGNTLVVETVTRIRGLREDQGREILLDATVRSRQQIRNDRIVSQEILSEQSQLYMGTKAPRVRVNAPDQVRVGEEFNFDVIVREPVGDDILLGAALEEKVSQSNYLNSQELDLEILPAGGIYRVGEAPTAPGQRWLSAIIVRDDGITTVSQRLNILPANAALSKSEKD